MNPTLRSALGLVATAAGGLAYASLVERNAFAVRRFTVPVLPAGARPVRLLHLSDMHLLPRQHRKIEWVRALDSLEPDLVVNTGDNLAALDAVPAVVHALSPLLERPGVFVLGSNDYYAPTPKNPALYFSKAHARLRSTVRLPTSELVSAFTGAGWVDLTNNRAAVTVGGLPFDLAGVDDPHLQRDRYADVAGRGDASAALTVGVLHAPYQRVLDAMAADGARLLIAGHTHGGQLALPFYGALVTNCDLDTRRAKGLSRWWRGAGSQPSSAAPADAAWLHVSAGLGTSPYAPVRFACRPEASLLTLTPA